MRKLYALLAGIYFALAAVPALAQADVANFTAIVNASGNATFTNTSVLGTVGGVRKALWSFGDGTTQLTGAIEGTQHQYQAAGSYTVCLKILLYTSNTTGPIITADICKTIVVQSVCRADFERGPTSSANPLTQTFHAIPWHSNQSQPVYICWNFGDGNDTCIQYSNTFPGPYNVNHTYTSAGEYEVCVRIVYQGGCEARKCKEINIPHADSCRADFERIPVTATNNVLHAAFKALPWHSNGKKPMKVCWTFGDGRDTCINYGQDYTGQYIVNHNYAHEGQYEVCVKIQYYGGCEAHKCKPVVINRPDSCSANFERLPVSTANHPLTVAFKALPWQSEGKKPMKICWRFGDGRDTCINYGQDYTGQYIVNHTYSQPGAYEVCVKIIYYGGCEAYKCKVIQVLRPDECRADFERIALSTTNNQLANFFKALPWHNNGKKPKTICWSFGDGRDTCINYGEDYNGPYVAGHSYAQPGVYEVCVKIIYYGGCDARKCKAVEVIRPDNCRAEFERLPLTTSNNQLTTIFKALPWHNNGKKPMRICWSFGDGRDTCLNYGQDYNGLYTVSHTYAQQGEYEVCVKIIYYGGCDARKCERVLVPHRQCNVHITEITPSATSLLRGFYANVISIPPRPVQRICWNFGDGSDTCINATASDPADLFIRHHFPGPGVYRVCAKVLFEGGCEAYDCEEVVIRSYTDICGGYMTDSLIGPRTFKFKAYPIHRPNDEVIAYRWTFGDGSTAIGREVVHTYNVAGDYRVCLTIVTRSGCETKICNTINMPGTNTPRLIITPNPVVNTLHALFYSTHAETVTIKVINSSGVVLRSVTRNAVVGANNWDFDASSLLPGYYTFVVQSPNQLASALFLKQ